MDAREQAVDIGIRLRRNRYRRGLTQGQLAEAAGISTSMLSRMELGAGLTVPLGVWLRVEAALGVDLFAPAQTTPFAAAVTALLRRGGWVPAGADADRLWFDREPRPVPGLRYLQRPAERAVVRVADVLTDPELEWRRLVRHADDVRMATTSGRSVQGVLLVIAAEDNRRRSGREGRRSSGPWVRALRDPDAGMPERPGWVWLARRGTHLLSVG